MATIQRDFFIAQFREEVSDHIRRITQRLFQLEERSGTQPQLVEEIFRIAHTLKGSSRMMGFPEISALAHKMEDLLVELRDDHLELTTSVTDLLFYTLDTINYLVEGIAKNVKRSADLDLFTQLFQDVIAGKQIEVPHLQSKLLSSQEQATAMSTPAKPSLPAESLDDGEDRQYIRIHASDLDRILNLVGEVIINQYRYEGQRAAYQSMLQDLREHRQELAELHSLAHLSNGPEGGARLAHLSETLEQSASLMLRKTKMLLKKFRTDSQQMRLTIDKLQEHVINIRMVPASRIFHLLPRLVRMTARKLRKTIELQLQGEDTTIDSRILEEMRDPLIHLVQNAIHHGIETPEKRQSYGKNPTGTISISASQEGNRIIIAVRDDGAGIDLERIKERAIQEGLLSHKRKNTISEQEVLEHLFLPGFSTSDTVDDISGRGFGLDIVRAHTDRMQGEIEVRSRPRQGTEFLLKLPLTLTIMNALLARMGDQVFALPTVAIEKTFDVTPQQIEYVGKMPVVVVEHSLLPVVELRHILQRPPQNDASSPLTFFQDADRKTVIVLHAEEHRIGVLVDDLIEEREIVIKHLGPCLKRVRNVAGATTVRGEVVIILFVRDLVRSADALLEGEPRYSQLAAHIRPADAAADGRERASARQILVVEDSPNTREVERAILEQAGYAVLTAENGAQGLELLKTHQIDAVVTDIEMPEIDGLTLTRTIKQDAAYAHLPVIIVSTKSSDDAKQQGFDAGANAYIVKGAFDDDTLLATLEQCLRPPE